MYIDTVKQIIEFSYLKPDVILKFVGINYNKQQLDRDAAANMQRLGMTSTSMLDSLITYLFIFGIFFVSILIVAVFYAFPCLR